MVVEGEEKADQLPAAESKPLATKTEIRIVPPGETADDKTPADTKDEPEPDAEDKPADEKPADDDKPANDDIAANDDTPTSDMPAYANDKPADDQPNDNDKPEAVEPDAAKGKDKPDKQPDEEAAAAAKAAEEAKLQKLVDDKKYFLPINAVEQRRTARVTVLGIILAILLVAVWVDIALDAGLINIAGLHPLTHFFSS